MVFTPVMGSVSWAETRATIAERMKGRSGDFDERGILSGSKKGIDQRSNYTVKETEQIALQPAV